MNAPAPAPAAPVVPDVRCFASTCVYSLARELGHEGADAEFRRQCAHPDRESLAVVRTFARLRAALGKSLSVFYDLGGSSVGKMRSRAAAAALASGADVWIACDDDVEATAETIADLLEAVRGEPSICIAPCVLRGEVEDRAVVNVALEPEAFDKPRKLASGSSVVPAVAGGFGLVAISRDALRLMTDAHPELAYLDDDGVRRCALFLELLDGERWWGEDLSFFRRVPPGVRVEALLTGVTAHAGTVLDLARVPDMARLSPPPKASDGAEVVPDVKAEVVIEATFEPPTP